MWYSGRDGFDFQVGASQTIAGNLEAALRKPVIDETRLSGTFSARATR
jgi:hypothetical protein